MRYTVRDHFGSSKIFDERNEIAATINDESLLFMLAETMHRSGHELVRESDGVYLAGKEPNGG